jgi:hypothetical protein
MYIQRIYISYNYFAHIIHITYSDSNEFVPLYDYKCLFSLFIYGIN